MKKIISLLLVISMLLIQLAACSTEDIKETEKPDESKDPITADESETPGETDEPEITERLIRNTRKPKRDPRIL